MPRLLTSSFFVAHSRAHRRPHNIVRIVEIAERPSWLLLPLLLPPPPPLLLLLVVVVVLLVVLVLVPVHWT